MPEPGLTTTFDAGALVTDFLSRLSGSPSTYRDPDTIPSFEDTWQDWLTTLFPQLVRAGFGPHHEAFWDWVWQLRPHTPTRPFIAIWPRGGGKSSSSELATVAVGARGVRRYGLYISATQELADRHVESIAEILESDSIARFYPALGNRHVSKYGSSRGWRRNRLRTAAGFTVDSVGLDTAVRGIKIEDIRPDFLIADDLDSVHDSLAATEKKIATLTQSILPAGSTDVAVLAVQNLIHPDSIFSRLAGRSEHPADFLANREVSGPYPAILDLEVEEQDGRSVIVRGTPLWSGQDLAACQHAIDTSGISAFLQESQQEVENAGGGMFDHLTFRRCDLEDVPDLVKIAVWVDPAVTDTDTSDSHGIQVDGIAADKTIYRLFSWEQRSSPERSLAMAITKAVEWGALEVGVETDQGGDTWRVVFSAMIEKLQGPGFTVDGRTFAIPTSARPPTFTFAKAGGGLGSKTHRASQMLVDYERGKIVHVRGTHDTLERGLRRFPKTKPFDLVDAAFYSWHALTNGPKRMQWA